MMGPDIFCGPLMDELPIALLSRGAFHSLNRFPHNISIAQEKDDEKPNGFHFPSVSIVFSNFFQNSASGFRQYGPQPPAEEPSTCLSMRIQTGPYSSIITSSKNGTMAPKCSLGR
jgi:hypothetical protein